MSAKQQPSCKASAAWMKATYGSGALAAFTGQDRRAFEAFVHALELYAAADMKGNQATLGALWFLLRAMQPSCWEIVKDAIPSVLDFSYVALLWPCLTAREPPSPPEPT